MFESTITFVFKASLFCTNSGFFIAFVVDSSIVIAFVVDSSIPHYHLISLTSPCRKIKLRLSDQNITFVNIHSFPEDAPRNSRANELKTKSFFEAEKKM